MVDKDKPGNGTDPGAAPPSGTQEGAGLPETQPDPSDYLGKIRANPDFAAEEVRRQMSEKDRVSAEHRKLVERLGGDGSALSQWLTSGQVSHDVIEQVVNHYIALKTDDRTKPYIEALETTGKLDVAGNGAPKMAPEDDEWLTDEQREIRVLKTQIEELRQGYGALSSSTGEEAVRKHLSRFRGEWHATDDEMSKISEAMSQQIANWRQTKEGRKLLQDLSDPAKYETVQTLALGVAAKAAPGIFDERSERKRRAQRSRVAPFATDGPPQRATTGNESEPDMRDWTPEKILRFIQEHPEHLPAE